MSVTNIPNGNTSGKITMNSTNTLGEIITAAVNKGHPGLNFNVTTQNNVYYKLSINNNDGGGAVIGSTMIPFMNKFDDLFFILLNKFNFKINSQTMTINMSITDSTVSSEEVSTLAPEPSCIIS